MGSCEFGGFGGEVVVGFLSWGGGCRFSSGGVYMYCDDDDDFGGSREFLIFDIDF